MELSGELLRISVAYAPDDKSIAVSDFKERRRVTGSLNIMSVLCVRTEPANVPIRVLVEVCRKLRSDIF